MTTQSNIFTTRKLEDKINGFICNETNITENDFIGDWSSSLFYISHKKWWLLLNKETKYVLILSNIKKSDLINIPDIFKKELFEQLKYDNINIKFEILEKIIGEIKLRQTDNDKKARGTLNNLAYFIKKWKSEYKNFENMPFRELCGRLNSIPTKKLNWKFSKEKMKEIIEKI